MLLIVFCFSEICKCYDDIFQAIFSLILPNLFIQVSDDDTKDLESLNSEEIEQNVLDKLKSSKIDELLDKLTTQDFRKLLAIRNKKYNFTTLKVSSNCLLQFLWF